MAYTMDISVDSILLHFLPYLACVERFVFNTLKALMAFEWRIGMGYQEIVRGRIFWDGWRTDWLRLTG